MKRHIVASVLDRQNRNGINRNFEHLFKGVEMTEDLNKRADSILTTSKNINSQNIDVQNQIDNLILSAGESDAEVIQARGRYSILNDRLSSVDANLAQTHDRMDGVAINPLYPPAPIVGAKPDANFYDSLNKRYYVDEEMTIPATDNLPTFQAIVNYLSGLGGGTIVVPSGNFCMKKEGSYQGVKWASKVSMVGAGVGSTKFVVEADLLDLFYNLDMPSNGTAPIEEFLEDVRFENFECDLIGLRSEHANVNGKAFFILGMRRARFSNLLLRNTIGTALGCDFLTETVIDRVVVYNAGRNWGVARPDGTLTTVGQSGIGVGTASLDEESLVISNCHAYNCGNNGIFVEQQGTVNFSKFAKVVDCYAEGNRIGFSDKGSHNTTFDGCTAYNNKEHGIEIRQSTQGDIITNCMFYENGGNGINFSANAHGNMLISNNLIFGNGGYGINSTRSSGATWEQSRDNVNITGNTIYKNGMSGCLVQGKHQGLLISNNNIFDNATLSINAYTDSGLYINNTKGVNITSNMIYNNINGTQNIGLRLLDEVSDVVIDGNNLWGNITQDVYISSNVLMDAISFGVNKGLNVIDFGKITMGDGVKAIDVNYNLISRARYINVTSESESNSHVWIKNSNRGSTFRIERENDVGEISVFWEVKY